ncbi:MAG: GNAT family N-acetyltransferase [Bdellovibrionales bacterium]|nr:GNAT family N-acetyltransferase [Bdellovibrionales bacterium]
MGSNNLSKKVENCVIASTWIKPESEVDDVGYFYGGSTRPELRGKGAYRGLVAHRLKLLKNQNIEKAFILARKDTSAPICRNLGFKVACEVMSYDFSL